MAKRIKTKLVANTYRENLHAVFNSMFTRSGLAAGIGLDGRKDIDESCGYPKNITTAHYKKFYEREGIASRVVNVLPEESWNVEPSIQESEKATDSAFEKEWKDLEKRFRIYSYMQRADIMSGIGQFGVILLGIGDGKKLTDPVDGVNDDPNADTKKTAKKQKTKLLYLRVFDQSEVKIKSVETDTNDYRYSQPTVYTITPPSEEGKVQASFDVHWTRIIHVADNRQSSEIYGTPRMQLVYNRLCDIRKILGGCAEMFWKGGFPGYSFEVDPNINAEGGVEIDYKKIREEFQAFSDGLQRYMALKGMSAKSLSPQVADPTNHFTVQLKAIAISLGIPYRILMGTEQAQLASDQDAQAWARRLSRRQEKYLSPCLVNPIVDRFIQCGILSSPKNGYVTVWPSNVIVDEDKKAGVAVKLTQALAQYVTSGAESVIAVKDFLVQVLGMSAEQADAVMEAAALSMADGLDDEEPTNADEDTIGDDENEDDTAEDDKDTGKTKESPAAKKKTAAR